MNIKKYTLKHEGFLFLKEVRVLRRIQESKHNSFSLSKEEVDTILDKLTDLFTFGGIYKDGEPNKLVLYIEGLIDVLREGM